MEEIKVSIIVPVYNVEKYLSQCLDSAIGQTLKGIEIIAVNDGSTDRSLYILKEYKKKYNNFFIIDQENKGLSAARNSGLNNAKGKYVYFLDSDDYIDKSLCEICYTECEKNKLDSITFDAEVFYDNDDLIKNNKFNYNRKSKLSSKVMTGLEFYEILLQSKAYKSSVCLFFYKKEFLEKNNIKFYPNILHEDEMFTSKILFYCNKIKYISNSLFFRRVRRNSIMTSSKSIKNAIGYYTVAEELQKLYKYKIKSNIIKNHINNFYVTAFDIALDLRDNSDSKILIKDIRKNTLFKGMGFKYDIKIGIPRCYRIIKRLFDKKK
ncbi:glycosyltransferase [Clostridium sp.]|uniref:glycosyltransferase n=1 Tax=Clostridium sp. TaxID=1506 RepID=UPI0035215DFA